MKVRYLVKTNVKEWLVESSSEEKAQNKINLIAKFETILEIIPLIAIVRL